VQRCGVNCTVQTVHPRTQIRGVQPLRSVQTVKLTESVSDVSIVPVSIMNEESRHLDSLTRLKTKGSARSKISLFFGFER
jgi:hypothetical protein